jgi:hypothetical protein
MSLNSIENNTTSTDNLDVKKIKLLRILINFKKQPERIMNGFLVLVTILMVITCAGLTFEVLKLHNDVKRLDNSNRSYQEINEKLIKTIEGNSPPDYLDNQEP